MMGGPDRPNRNRATANAFASLMMWIVRRRAVSTQASDAMMALLDRPLNPLRKDDKGDTPQHVTGEATLTSLAAVGRDQPFSS